MKQGPAPQTPLSLINYVNEWWSCSEEDLPSTGLPCLVVLVEVTLEVKVVLKLQPIRWDKRGIKDKEHQSYCIRWGQIDNVKFLNHINLPNECITANDANGKKHKIGSIHLYDLEDVPLSSQTFKLNFKAHIKKMVTTECIKSKKLVSCHIMKIWRFSHKTSQWNLTIPWYLKSDIPLTSAIFVTSNISLTGNGGLHQCCSQCWRGWSKPELTLQILVSHLGFWVS